MSEPDVQVSLVTPPGEGGIGVIVVRGSGGARVLDRAFVGTRVAASDLPPGRIAHGTIRRDDRVVDEVIVAHVQAAGPPLEGSHYEVGCHGGIVAVRAVLDCLAEAGATLVEARELAGPPPSGLSRPAVRQRALSLLPSAPTRLAARMLLHQAAGVLSRELDRVAALLAGGDAGQAERGVRDLLATADLGLALLHPPKVALLGPPNVGKSTLLNALLEEERVIVHHEPGTTRDVVAERVSVRGVPFELQDSAGLRQSDDDLERMAVSHAEALARRCDVALLVFDLREGPQSALEAAQALRPAARAVLVGNKADLAPRRTADADAPAQLQGLPLVCVSALNRSNIEALEDALLAPYSGPLARCRAGGAMLFDAATATTLGEVADALADGRQQDARAALLNATAPGPLTP